MRIHLHQSRARLQTRLANEPPEDMEPPVLPVRHIPAVDRRRRRERRAGRRWRQVWLSTPPNHRAITPRTSKESPPRLTTRPTTPGPAPNRRRQRPATRFTFGASRRSSDGPSFVQALPARQPPRSIRRRASLPSAARRRICDGRREPRPWARAPSVCACR